MGLDFEGDTRAIFLFPPAAKARWMIRLCVTSGKTLPVPIPLERRKNRQFCFEGGAWELDMEHIWLPRPGPPRLSERRRWERNCRASARE